MQRMKEKTLFDTKNNLNVKRKHNKIDLYEWKWGSYRNDGENVERMELNIYRIRISMHFIVIPFKSTDWEKERLEII